MRNKHDEQYPSTRTTKNNLDDSMRFENGRLCSILRKSVHYYRGEFIALTKDNLYFPLTGKGKCLKTKVRCPSSKSKEPT